MTPISRVKTVPEKGTSGTGGAGRRLRSAERRHPLARCLSRGRQAPAPPSRAVLDAAALREAALRRLQRLAETVDAHGPGEPEVRKELVDALLHCRAVSLDLVEAFDRWRISGSRGGDLSPRLRIVPMALTAHLPSGVLRPPVAVGPLLDEPEPFYSSASPKKSFYGGWSFPAVQLDDDPPEPSAPRAESPPVPPRGPERRGWDLAGSNEVPIHNAPVSVRPPGSLAPQRLGAPISPRPLPALPSALSIPSTRVDSFPRPVPSGDPYVPQRPLSPAPLQDPYAPRLLEPQRFELQGRGGLTQDPYAPYNMLDRRPSQVRNVGESESC
eukprot:symbB.v1.2.000007.t1/scaffold5.1/size591573/7